MGGAGVAGFITVYYGYQSHLAYWSAPSSPLLLLYSSPLICTPHALSHTGVSPAQWTMYNLEDNVHRGFCNTSVHRIPAVHSQVGWGGVGWGKGVL